MPARDLGGNILHNICDSFRPFVRELWKDVNYGLCSTKIDIEKLHYSGADKSKLADQFTLVLPYAGNQLKWEVLFDAARPWFAPDFRFDDDRFLSNVDGEFIENNVPSLAGWNEEDPKALSCVIRELMKLYRDHQKKLLNEDGRAYFEYKFLVENAPENELEILVGRDDSVNFMIKLNIECSNLPSLFDEDPYENPGSEYAILHVKYPNSEKADLKMSRLVSLAVGDFPVPQLNPDITLFDYIPEITKEINEKIQSAFTNKILRQQELSSFITKYENSILEHGTKTASFLFDVKGFYCILQIEIGNKYTDKQPIYTLRSVYHTLNDKPIVKKLPIYFDKDTDNYINGEIEKFKDYCENFQINNELKM